MILFPIPNVLNAIFIKVSHKKVAFPIRAAETHTPIIVDDKICKNMCTRIPRRHGLLLECPLCRAYINACKGFIVFLNRVLDPPFFKKFSGNF